MLGEFPESTVDEHIEPDRFFAGYRWSKRASAVGVLALSAIFLVFGVLALLLLGVPIALVTGAVEGNWQTTKDTLAQIWRLSPLLLAAELVLAWLLVALYFIARRILAKFGAAIA